MSETLLASSNSDAIPVNRVNGPLRLPDSMESQPPSVEGYLQVIYEENRPYAFMAYGEERGPKVSNFTLVIPAEKVQQLISDLSNGLPSATDAIPVKRVNRPNVFGDCVFLSPVMDGFLQVVYEESKTYVYLAYGTENGPEKSDFTLIVPADKVPQLISDFSNGLASALCNISKQDVELPSNGIVNSSSPDEMEPDVRQYEIAGRFEYWRFKEHLKLPLQDTEEYPTTLECVREFHDGKYTLCEDNECVGCKFSWVPTYEEYENCPARLKLRELNGSQECLSIA